MIAISVVGITQNILQQETLSGSTVQFISAPSLEDIGAVDLDLLNRPVTRSRTYTAQLVDNILTLNNLAEHSVLAVEVRGRAKGDEELTAVGVRARVGHAESALALVSERWDELVRELAAPDRRATATSSLYKLA